MYSEGEEYIVPHADTNYELVFLKFSSRWDLANGGH